MKAMDFRSRRTATVNALKLYPDGAVNNCDCFENP